ncbi:4Fe-4S single cluster domain-containing protein [Actinophytocola sp. KF-1]
MLRVSRVHFPVTTLGPGSRLVIWVQGCPLACRGCMSRDTWDEGGGADLTEHALLGLWSDALRRGADGMTISGGEPLAQAEPVAAFLRAARSCPAPPGTEPDFLLYTGFELDELDPAQDAAVAAADAVITGRYEAGSPTRLIWRGSANQRLRATTDLGRRRYTPYLGAEPDRAPVQIGVDGERLWVIGVPPPGALSHMERALRARGVRIQGATWRP